MDILELIVDHMIAIKSQEATKHLRSLLLGVEGDRQVMVMLKMGYFYQQQGQYANARACLLKYIEKRPVNSGLSWRLLGNFVLI